METEAAERQSSAAITNSDGRTVDSIITGKVFIMSYVREPGVVFYVRTTCFFRFYRSIVVRYALRVDDQKVC